LVFDQQRSFGEALLEVKPPAKMHVALPLLLPDGRHKTSEHPFMPLKRSIGAKIEVMRDAEDAERFHKQMLEAARWIVLTKRRNEFTVQEIALRVREDYPEFSERAIREGIAANSRQLAPARNGGSEVAFERIGPTGYRLVNRFGLARRIEGNRILVPGRSNLLV
jgi:hypothetical protein